MLIVAASMYLFSRASLLCAALSSETKEPLYRSNKIHVLIIKSSATLRAVLRQMLVVTHAPLAFNIVNTMISTFGT